MELDLDLRIYKWKHYFNQFELWVEGESVHNVFFFKLVEMHQVGSVSSTWLVEWNVSVHFHVLY